MRGRRYFLLASLACGVFYAGKIWSQPKMRRVGILTITDIQPWYQPFYETLKKEGWIEGQNLTYEFRHANGDPTRFAEPLAELVRTKPDVIFAVGPPAVRAAFASIKDIPIVAHDLESDPVVSGYAKSYARPGGNLTGIFLDSPDLAGKWVEILKSIVPRLSRATVLWDSTSGPIPLQSVKSVAPHFGVKLQVLEIHNPEEIDSIPRALRNRPQALIILPSPMMYVESKRLAEMAKKLRLPAASMFRPFAENGGLLAFGPRMPDTAKRCGALVAKILRGEKPGDIPIERPDYFEYVVNDRAAEALGFRLPDSVLLRADEVLR